MESRWVNDEIDLAWNLKNTPDGKTIIPVLYRACEPRADLRTRHIISFLPPRPYEAALAETLAALGIRAIVTDPASDTAASAAPLARASTDIVEQFAPQIAAAYAERDWPDVVRKAEFLLRRAPDRVTAPIQRMLGIALLEEGAALRARETLDAARTLDPLDLDSLRAAARAAIVLGDAATAHALLDDALALASDRAQRLQLLADDAYVLRLAGDAEEELRRCNEALRLTPDDVDWRARRVVALARVGRSSEAQAEMELLARATTTRPSADSAPHVRAQAHSLQQALTGEARSFAQAKTQQERHASAERFATLLTRNVAAASVRDDPLSLQRRASPRLPERLAALGYVMRPVGNGEMIMPPLSDVEAGRCLLSDSASWSLEGAASDLPHRWVTLTPFQIMRYPVTVAEYACFVQATGREPQRWESGDQRLDWRMQQTRPDHPVVCVTWHDALAYASWLAELTGQRWRLLTEAEWEAAARWDAKAQQARSYPWGETFDAARCNCAMAVRMTTPVGSYPGGASPCGALDMAGNVWEWTSNLADDNAVDVSRDALPTEIAMLRGGSWVSAPAEVSGAARSNRLPNGYSPTIGFRLAHLPG
jgi:formylglycine-generating enzyme required for sulfatase activity